MTKHFNIEQRLWRFGLREDIGRPVMKTITTELTIKGLKWEQIEDLTYHGIDATQELCAFLVDHVIGHNDLYQPTINLIEENEAQ